MPAVAPKKICYLYFLGGAVPASKHGPQNKMPQSPSKMLRSLNRLVDEYLAFQRSRPDLPQGCLSDLSEDELEKVVEAFLLHKSEQDRIRSPQRPSRLH
jgi:hypothetical protein